MALPDLDGMTDQELAELTEAANVELQRRRAMADAPQRAQQAKQRAEERLDQIAAGYLVARDGYSGVPEAAPAWVQPTGPHSWYPRGWCVTHGGKLWRSVISGNAHEPDGGDHGQAWVEIVSEPEPGQYLPWGPGQEVVVGDLRTHAGRLWSAKVDHTTHVGWEPSVHTYAVWEDMGPVDA